AQAHLVHLVQDPALHRLQAVPRVGERALVDDAVGVLEVAAAHLLGDVDVDDIFFEILGGRVGTASSSCHQRCAAGTPALRLGAKPRSLLSACPPGNVGTGPYDRRASGPARRQPPGPRPAPTTRTR